MYNRYVGNTGRFIRVDDEPVIVPRAEIIDHADDARRQERKEREETRHHQEHTEKPLPTTHGGSGLASLLGGKGGLLGGKGLFGGKSLGFLDNILPFGMDTGDLAMIALFFFLYLESGDDEFLIITAFLAYSIFKDRPKDTRRREY